MRIAKRYSHKNGLDVIMKSYPKEYADIEQAIAHCNAVDCLMKISGEKTKPPLLFHPESMNVAMKRFLSPLGWTLEHAKSKKGFREPRVKLGKREFREMDGIKNRVGLEIQFGKYAFMGYDIFSKMVIFSKHNLIDCGIEVVVMPEMIREMSTGVSSYNQITMDMEARGAADLDIPTLVVGITLTPDERTKCDEKRAKFLTQRDEMIARGEVHRPRSGGRPGPKGIGSLYEEEEEESGESE